MISMTPNIIIRKQKFRIRTHDENTALRIRKEINDSIQYDFIHMLEKIMQEHSIPDFYFYIDKISVDLGAIHFQNFNETFMRLLQEKLSRELSVKTDEQITTAGANKESYYYNETNDTGERMIEDQAFPFAEKNRATRALIYFLEYGIYPWWYHQSVAKSPAEILDEDTDTLTSLSLKIIEQNKISKIVAERMTRRLIHHLPAGKKDRLVKNILSLKNEPAVSANANALLEHKEILKTLFDFSETEFQVSLVLVLLNETISPGNLVSRFIRKFWTEKETTIEKLDTIMAKADEDVRDFISEQITDLSKHKKNTDPGSNREGKKAREMFEEKITKDPSRFDSEKTPALPEEGIYISNAGLVLIHPFLDSLFTELGFLDPKKQFYSENAALRATINLQYLQTGDNDYREWESALCKILCGLPVATVLPSDIVLTDSEKSECDEMLKVILEYWDALRSTDINVLRANFFNRDGKLMAREDHWLLHVERTGIDILLEKLPWGYSTIKLPWLQQIIHVEW